MTNEKMILSTTPLSRADQAELLEFLPEDSVEFAPAKLAPGELGEPAMAIAIVSLSMVTISALCTWLAAKGHGVSLNVHVNAPGGVAGGFDLKLNENSKPEAVRAEVEKVGGGKVPAA
jgi:hypothetical protein